MDLLTYVPLAVRTEVNPVAVLKRLGVPDNHDITLKSHQTIRLLHAAIGVAGEAGEITQAYDVWKGDTKKRKLDIDNISEEIGDSSWYCAIARDTYPEVFAGDHLMGYAMFGKKKTGAIIRELEHRTAAFLDTAKGAFFYGKEVTPDQVRIHVHDVEGSLMSLAVSLRLDIEKIRSQNIAKLSLRFPDKYTDDAAINRNLLGEKEVLDQHDTKAKGKK